MRGRLSRHSTRRLYQLDAKLSNRRSQFKADLCAIHAGFCKSVTPCTMGQVPAVPRSATIAAMFLRPVVVAIVAAIVMAAAASVAQQGGVPPADVRMLRLER